MFGCIEKNKIWTRSGHLPECPIMCDLREVLRPKFFFIKNLILRLSSSIPIHETEYFGRYLDFSRKFLTLYDLETAENQLICFF